MSRGTRRGTNPCEIDFFQAIVDSNYIIFHRTVRRGTDVFIQGFIVDARAYLTNLVKNEIEKYKGVTKGNQQDPLVLAFFHKNKSFVARPRPDGSMPKEAKLAKLIYRRLGDTERYHLLAVELLTGRHHQIRCQLAHMGCVIKGDLKYGAPRSNPDGSICLHAREIRLIHPVKKTELVVTAPVPAAWKGVESIVTP